MERDSDFVKKKWNGSGISGSTRKLDYHSRERNEKNRKEK